MQAIDTERSPGLPSLMVTTRRRLMPHGTSCSFLQAVTQALHSMQRSASQRNLTRAMIYSPLTPIESCTGSPCPRSCQLPDLNRSSLLYLTFRQTPSHHFPSDICPLV